MSRRLGRECSSSQASGSSIWVAAVVSSAAAYIDHRVTGRIREGEAIVLNSTVAGTGAFGGALFAGAFGYLRALDSNKRLERQVQALDQGASALSPRT